MAIIAFCITAVLQINVKRWKSKLKQDHLWKISFAFFAWLSISWFWDEGQTGFGKYIERYALFAFFPIILLGTPPFSKNTIHKVGIAFTGVLLVLSGICLFRAYNDFALSGDSTVFFYHPLSEQVGLSAIFLSNYCVAAITWLFYFQFIDPPARDKVSPKKQAGWINWQIGVVVLTCLLLIFIIFLLASRLLLVILLLELLFLILYAAYLRRKLLLGALIIGILLFVSGVVIVSSTNIRERWNDVSFETDRSIDPSNAFANRVIMWQTTYELIQEKPLLGYGLKSYEPYVLNRYKEKGFIEGVDQKLNSHNQYLQTWLNVGIPGFILFIILLISMLVTSIKKSNCLLFLLLGHYMLHSMVESTLQVQYQLIFFWFFLFLFYYKVPDK